MKQELKERLARLGPIRDIDRVSSGSPVDLVIRPADGLAKVNTIETALALARRHMQLADAKAAVERMVEEGEAAVHVPMVENETALAEHLSRAGIAAGKLACRSVDPGAIRTRLGLTTQQFAMRYGFDQSEIESWEDGRAQPDKLAKAYLRAIAADPEQVAKAQEEVLA